MILLVILAVLGTTESCPTSCQCFQQHATCTNPITDLLDNTTTSLHLLNLDPEPLQLILDQDLPLLSDLLITNSDLSNTSLDLWPELRTLIITSSKIIHPRLVSGENLTEIYKLDLSLNLIQVIEPGEFVNLRTLQVLNLSDNSIREVEKGSFDSLVELKCLDLSGNKLLDLKEEALRDLLQLQHLNLSRNQLQVINSSFSKLVKLQQLDISWNKLVRITPGSLELPSLTRLLLTGNPQLGSSREASVLVGTGRRLQIVDASRTGLVKVPTSLTHSIRTLRLSNNRIRTISRGDLDSYPLLQLLDMNSNQMEMIEDDALGRLDSLSVLYLKQNALKDIPKSLPESLKALHLESNAIRRVSSEDLQGLDELEVLLLSDNNVRVIEEGAFNHLLSLVTLDLSNNPLSRLEAGSLSGPFLQVLRLASIKAASPAEELSFPLSTPENLITLDLSSSPGLARQFLADTSALAASKALQELDLSHNSLENIRTDLLHFLPQLRLLHLAGNNLNCTSLDWLGSWMRRQDLEEYNSLTCANPPELWGTFVIDLQQEERIVFTTTTKKATTEQPEPSSESNQILDLEVPPVLSLESVDLTNSTSVVSKYVTEAENIKTGKVLFLLVVATLVILSLALVVVRTSKKRKLLLPEEIEIRDLPGMTELW